MSDSVGRTGDDHVLSTDALAPPIGRRRFLLWAAGASLGASAVFVGATVIQAMVPPARSADGRKSAGNVVVARLSDLELGKAKLAEYGQDKVFVVKTSADRVLAFNAACPHLGCALVVNERTGGFDCPCHRSSFSVEGVRRSGPAPRNMIAADAKIVNGEVVVSGFRA